MARTVGVVFVLALLSGNFDAKAQTASQQPPNAGKCPVGTCAKSGGQWAKNVKNCSPSYCKR